MIFAYIVVEICALAIAVSGAYSWGVRSRKRVEAREYEIRKAEHVDAVYTPEFDPGFSHVKQPVRDPENNALLGYVSYNPSTGDYQLYGANEV